MLYALVGVALMSIVVVVLMLFSCATRPLVREGAPKETAPQFSIKTPDKDKFLVKSPRMGLTPRRID
jgi:hypothetical protein